MKIVHLAFSDCAGGAARAAFRLHLGLKATGHESSMLVLRKSSADPSVRCADDSRTLRGWLWDKIALHQIHFNRTAHANSHFSFCEHDVDVTQHPLLRQADVINLHWVAEYQSPRSIARLQSLGVPVVLTLHDQRAFTGGCHYSAGCTRYETDCQHCPQILDNECDFPAAALSDSATLIDPTRLTVVSPSRWLADCARHSRVFKNAHVEVIPYGLETDIFRPRDRAATRSALGLPQKGRLILYGAENTSDTRKGMRELQEALRLCRQDAQFDEQLHSGAISLVSFGETPDRTFAREFGVHEFGYVNSDETMASLYAAADLFAMPSLQDNLPNMVLEAMSCGTAVAAFSIGGVPDLIEDNVSGHLAARTDSAALAATILAALAEPAQLDELGANGRKRIEQRHQLEHQAQAYVSLYQTLPRTDPKAVLSARTHLESLFFPLLRHSLPGIARGLSRKLTGGVRANHSLA